MAPRTQRPLSGDILRLLGAGTLTGLSESELLERFIGQRDELAFEAIVRQLGPMVLGVCRRQLRNPGDVEDAFQATFLILVRKAALIRDRGALGAWLHGVAYRVAVRARRDAARRAERERPGVEFAADKSAADDLHRDRLQALDAELNRLPANYRAAVVLCCLGEHSCEEAALRLGCPVGTVKSRLARARERLRWGLIRRGIAPAASIAAALLSSRHSPAAVPDPLVRTTVRIALWSASRRATQAAASRAAVTLAERMVRSMALGKLKLAAAVVLACGVLGAGAGSLAYQAPATGAKPTSAFDEFKHQMEQFPGWKGGIRVVSEGDVEVSVRVGSLAKLDEARLFLEPVLARGPIRVILEGAFQESASGRPREGFRPQLSAVDAARPDSALANRLQALEHRVDALASERPREADDAARRTGPEPGTFIRVRARFDAQVEKVHFTVGQRIKKGDPLIDLFSIDLAQDKSDFQTKFVQWHHDQRLLRAREELFKTGAVSRQQLVDTQNNEKKSYLDFTLARDKLKVHFQVPDDEIEPLLEGLADVTPGTSSYGKIKNKARFTLRSPIDGIVIERRVVPGDFYKTSDLLMVIAPSGR